MAPTRLGGWKKNLIDRSTRNEVPQDMQEFQERALSGSIVSSKNVEAAGAKLKIFQAAKIRDMQSSQHAATSSNMSLRNRRREAEGHVFLDQLALVDFAGRDGVQVGDDALHVFLRHGRAGGEQDGLDPVQPLQLDHR